MTASIDCDVAVSALQLLLFVAKDDTSTSVAYNHLLKTKSNLMGEQSVKGQQRFDKMIAKIRATISFLLFSTFQEKRAKV